jgi:SAM-dependent methyltransferase
MNAPSALSGPYPRTPYQGVIQILQFNWVMYLITVIGAGTACIALPFVPAAGRIAIVLGITPALYWIVSSLAVSHYVYDRFPLYDLSWIARVLADAPRRWINIHSGLDETSGLLAALFPKASGEIVDIFDSSVMTERSIRQARRTQRSAVPAVSARYDALPFADGSFDAAFSIFAAHELRRHEQRTQLFREVARVLARSGTFIVMEHVRDWRNFLAFGPGFLHFFSRGAWRKAIHDAGLTLQAELSMSPFVHVYILRRNL